MPELPEVTTTVNGLQKVLPGLVFVDIWTDLSKKNQKVKQFQDTIKNDVFFKKFKKKVIGKKVLRVERRAKNILIHISGGYTILIHLKMTGHLLFGEYKQVVGSKQKVVSWVPDKNERKSLSDPCNRFIHVVFTFSGVKHLAFCDSRKFGKVTIIPTHDLENTLHLKNIGPEPLEKIFTFEKFKDRLFLKTSGKIKTILMDQTVIAGIGNIYSDEMLWSSSIHPESNSIKIPPEKLLKLYKEMKKVLTKGIDFGGDSMSDYRNIHGEKGNFQNKHNVYQKKNTKCGKHACSGVIMRKVINGRSTHFCNVHQKLFV
ncbi:MAG: bifunctional DNA-formamidopyrimidine glycosylase/DNA-(apurinic or apyrimidinic site) lyase [Candidatus Paceibacterota bacterium]|jgi:formamidopyrimidine-DNA glycosylase